MKYCSFCGCYIPDDWSNCPACGKKNYTSEIYSNKTYGKSALAQAVLNNERIYPYYNGLYSSPEFIRIARDYMNELYKMEIKINDN